MSQLAAEILWNRPPNEVDFELIKPLSTFDDLTKRKIRQTIFMSAQS